jgi:hypothetical protein
VAHMIAGVRAGQFVPWPGRPCRHRTRGPVRPGRPPQYLSSSGRID